MKLWGRRKCFECIYVTKVTIESFSTEELWCCRLPDDGCGEFFKEKTPFPSAFWWDSLGVSTAARRWWAVVYLLLQLTDWTVLLMHVSLTQVSLQAELQSALLSCHNVFASWLRCAEASSPCSEFWTKRNALSTLLRLTPNLYSL